MQFPAPATQGQFSTGTKKTAQSWRYSINAKQYYIKKSSDCISQPERFLLYSHTHKIHAQHRCVIEAFGIAGEIVDPA